MLSDDDVMECMRAFCNDQQIDINTRLSILEKLKKIVKSMSDTDMMLLLVYKTNAILAHSSSLQSTSPVDASTIETESKRRELLLEWIEQANTDEDYSALLNLARIWPRFPTDPPILVLLAKLVLNRGKLTDLLDSIDADETRLELTSSDLDTLETRLRATPQWSHTDERVKRNFLKVCLAFRSDENLEFVLARLKSTDELECFRLMEDLINDDLAESCESYRQLVDDHELAALIHRDRFYTRLINTKIYAVFVRNLVNTKEKTELLSVVTELLNGEDRRDIEAGYLLSTAENFFPVYRTLSTSLALVNNNKHFNNE